MDDEGQTAVNAGWNGEGEAGGAGSFKSRTVLPILYSRHKEQSLQVIFAICEDVGTNHDIDMDTVGIAS